MNKLSLANISFVEYYELKDKSGYDYALRYGEFEDLDMFNIGDLMDKSYGFVKDAQELLNYTGLTWEKYFDLISKEMDYPLDAIADYSLFNLQQSRLWLRDAIQEINKIESSALGHQASQAEEAANISRFEKYKSFISIDNLAGGDILKHDEIRSLPYYKCFVKLTLDSDRSSYSEDYQNAVRALSAK